MPNFAQFATRGINKIQGELANGSARTIRRVTRAFVKEVVLGTPVDTGVHRSNWRVGVGRRPGGVIKAFAPGKGLGIGERANAAATISAAESQISKIRPGRGRAVDFNVTVANNAPVIGAINSGRISQQQDPGFIDRALQTSQVRLRQSKIFGFQQEF